MPPSLHFVFVHRSELPPACNILLLFSHVNTYFTCFDTKVALNCTHICAMPSLVSKIFSRKSLDEQSRRPTGTVNPPRYSPSTPSSHVSRRSNDKLGLRQSETQRKLMQSE